VLRQPPAAGIKPSAITTKAASAAYPHKCASHPIDEGAHHVRNGNRPVTLRGLAGLRQTVCAVVAGMADQGAARHAARVRHDRAGGRRDRQRPGARRRDPARDAAAPLPGAGETGGARHRILRPPVRRAGPRPGAPRPCGYPAHPAHAQGSRARHARCLRAARQPALSARDHHRHHRHADQYLLLRA